MQGAALRMQKDRQPAETEERGREESAHGAQRRLRERGRIAGNLIDHLQVAGTGARRRAVTGRLPEREVQKTGDEPETQLEESDRLRGEAEDGADGEADDDGHSDVEEHQSQKSPANATMRTDRPGYASGGSIE